MKRISNGMKDWLRDFGKALIFFVVIQTFFFQGFVIEGSCMEPGLNSEEKIIVNKLIYRYREPHLGEVVVFSFPLDPNKDFIKRVVGVSGDIIMIRNGYLYRNGEKMEEPFVKEYVFGDFGPVEVPDGQIYVMGDNRNNSHDSRSWGFLDITSVKGRAEIKFWPLWSMGLIRSAS